MGRILIVVAWAFVVIGLCSEDVFMTFLYFCAAILVRNYFCNVEYGRWMQKNEFLQSNRGKAIVAAYLTVVAVVAAIYPRYFLNELSSAQFAILIAAPFIARDFIKDVLYLLFPSRSGIR